MGKPPLVVSGTIRHCAICRSWDLEPLLDMGYQPLAERHDSDHRYPLELVRCRMCTLVQLSYAVDEREVFPLNHPYTSGSTRALREHFTSFAAELSPLLTPGDVVVDIGANDGTLLSAVGGGLRRVGVEPTDQALKLPARGIAAYQEFFGTGLAKRIVAEHGPAKVITACNVLAHTRDIHGFMISVHRLLADDGVFAAEVHDVSAVLDGLQIDTVYHEHMYYFSLTSLGRLFGMHGLQIDSAERIPVHGGSIRVYARKPRRDVSSRAQVAASSLRVLLDGAAQEGPIYGIGATTRATPLIHYAKIADYIACVCEVSSSEKIGTLMPGTGIPVVDEEKLIADQPPYALLLAWHLRDSLIPALRAKGYQGKFIIPLPSPEVVSA